MADSKKYNSYIAIEANNLIKIMPSLIAILILVPLTLAFTMIFVQSKDRYWVWKVMVVGWVCLLPLLALANSWFPFAEGGDDETYFILAATPFGSLTDAFDLTRYIGLMEQPGYPWILSILYQFTGEDLLAFKILNLAFFIMLVPVGYRIGYELESRDFGRSFSVLILLLMPLWFYWMLLYKDIVIALLQSMFLLSVVQISRSRGRGGWGLMVASTLAVIPFRSPLVLLNIAVLAGTLVLMSFRSFGKRTLITIIFAAVMMGGVLTLARNADLMAVVGIDAEQRVVGSEAMMEMAAHLGEESILKRGLFPLLYLLSETAGMNPQTWVEFGVGSLRGILAVPWVLIGVPFLLVGIAWLLRRDKQAATRGGFFARIKITRFIATPWGAVLMFILAYMAVSWQVGDTTRWRVSDMLAMAVIALAGWRYSAPRMRYQFLYLWISVSGALFSLFYLIREL